MSNKVLKRKRMWEYFINAAEDQIKTKGLRNTTIRGVAEKAGYNSATIYNYFDEFSHLLFFASYKIIQPYIEEVSKRINEEKEPINRYVAAWDCFSEYSFQHPEIFETVFLIDLGIQPDQLLEQYYEIYPEDLQYVPETLRSLFKGINVMERGRVALEKIVQTELLTIKEADELNEITNLIWQSMITNFINNRTSYNAKEAHEKTMKFVKGILNSYIEGK